MKFTPSDRGWIYFIQERFWERPNQTAVDWQLKARYLRHLSFYTAPSCLKVHFIQRAWLLAIVKGSLRIHFISAACSITACSVLYYNVNGPSFNVPWSTRSFLWSVKNSAQKMSDSFSITITGSFFFSSAQKNKESCACGVASETRVSTSFKVFQGVPKRSLGVPKPVKTYRFGTFQDVPWRW